MDSKTKELQSLNATVENELNRAGGKPFSYVIPAAIAAFAMGGIAAAIPALAPSFLSAAAVDVAVSSVVLPLALLSVPAAGAAIAGTLGNMLFGVIDLTKKLKNQERFGLSETIDTVMGIDLWRRVKDAGEKRATKKIDDFLKTIPPSQLPNVIAEIKNKPSFVQLRDFMEINMPSSFKASGNVAAMNDTVKFEIPFVVEVGDHENLDLLKNSNSSVTPVVIETAVNKLDRMEGNLIAGVRKLQEATLKDRNEPGLRL